MILTKLSGPLATGILISWCLGCDGRSATQPQPTQSAKSLSGVFSNERLKKIELEDYPIGGNDYFRFVDGIWVPESNDPAKAMTFPEQASITCTKSDQTCRELYVTLAPNPVSVVVLDINEKDWSIRSWDGRGLLAFYGPDITATQLSERCHSHVLSMAFGSGAVSTSDIPTHENGCEAFKETDSYRLARGNYYVDTSPGNDSEKSPKKQ